MHLLCNAYWLDTDALQGCDLPKIKEVTYGFNQNTDVVATLPPSPLDNFCASAKHNSSPNTYSIDSAALISSGDYAPKCLREGCKSSYTVDNPPECTREFIEWAVANGSSPAAWDRPVTEKEVCIELTQAGICYSSFGNCKVPESPAQIAWALQRRKEIKSGRRSGEQVEWMGYEGLHGPAGCRGYNYYGGRGWAGGCADREFVRSQ